MSKKKKFKIRNIIILFISLSLIIYLGYTAVTLIPKIIDKYKVKPIISYLAGDTTPIKLYDDEYNQVLELYRGTKVDRYEKEIINNEVTYNEVVYNETKYLVETNHLVLNYNEVIFEKELYIRTTSTIYEDSETPNIVGLIKKGNKATITAFDKLDDKGLVNMYKISYNDIEGYVYSKYIVFSKAEADAYYDEKGISKVHLARKDTLKLGAGTPGTLDYYPYEKPEFEDNVMPKEVRSLYVNGGVLNNIDNYIKLAKENNINAFVVDIKENGAPSYKSEVMKELSPTTYKKAFYSAESFGKIIKKLKDNGFYVIGRITTFKDNYYVNDNKEDAILNSAGKAFYYNGSYWPTAFSRNVWEYNVKIAIEAVKLFDLDEIQFDYVRFPDRTGYLENNGTINFNNTYKETKAEAIQTFLMYACDNIHKYNAYVSADVFGESANGYVTGYGQYWPAISNIVDVISGMPYPDHFNKYEYGFDVPVWTIPYQLLKTWGKTAMLRQKETATPAVVRTWIQAYNTIHSPYITYGPSQIEEQIKGLYEAGLTGGYMTWNGSSSLNKYTEIASAFRKDYLN